MDWHAFWVAFGALGLGCALRLLLPYLTAGLQAITEGGWSAWPPFEAKYVASFLLALIGYSVALVTSDAALASLMEMSFTSVVLVGYTGGDLARVGVKLLFTKLR